MEQRGICYIVGAGELGEEFLNPKAGDFVIACDGGFLHCQNRNVQPDLVVGDFDSLGFLPEEGHVVRLNPVKDETDMAWAVKEGRLRGYREFVIYGGSGGRISHTIANIQLLTELTADGCKGVLIGKSSRYFVICNEEMYFDEKETGYLSVFCLGDRAEGVYEEGLKYCLENAVMTKEVPVGVSNEFIGKKSRVAVRDGVLLLITEKK